MSGQYDCHGRPVSAVAGNWTPKKMLENRPNGALGTLVKLVRSVKFFRIVRYRNNIFRIVQTVQNISNFEIVRNVHILTVLT